MTTAPHTTTPRGSGHDETTTPEISGAHVVAVAAIALVTVVSVVSWRTGAIFDGGIDGVVIAKAALSALALAGAVATRLLSRARHPLGARSTFLLALALGVSLVGALASGNLLPSAIVTVRIAVLAAIVLVLLSCTPWRIVLTAILTAMGVVAVVAAVTGAASYGATGRLAGGIPEVQENELAGLAALPLLGLLVLLVRKGVRWWIITPAAVLATILWATQSRTALVALALAIVIAFIVAPRVHWSAIVLVLAAVPVGYAVLAFTSLVEDLLVRDQTAAEIASLSARTDAWKVVLEWAPASWERWIGLGLSVKQIDVDLPFREVQVFDSSWVSLLAQAGLIGTAVVVCWMRLTVRDAADREVRSLAIPLLTLLLVRGLTENGLLDASAAFLVVFCLAIGVDPASRREAVPSTPPREAAYLRSPERFAPHHPPLTPQGATP